MPEPKVHFHGETHVVAGDVMEGIDVGREKGRGIDQLLKIVQLSLPIKKHVHSFPQFCLELLQFGLGDVLTGLSRFDPWELAFDVDRAEIRMTDFAQVKDNLAMELNCQGLLRCWCCENKLRTNVNKLI